MAREVISTSILIIATVVAVSAAIMVILPTVRDLSHSYVSVAGNLNEKVETDMEIIFIKVVPGTTTVDVYFWVKNTGNTKLDTDLINMSDIFITSDSSFLHFTANDARVNFTVQNGDGDEYWEKGETLNVVISGLSQDTELPPNEYVLTFVLYNGVKTSDSFSW